jgi:large subunit ribosomal protein L30
MTEQKTHQSDLGKGPARRHIQASATVKGLGLRHREHTVELADTPAIRGMINQVSYLVKVEG